jgi:hypothetical protein
MTSAGRRTRPRSIGVPGTVGRVRAKGSGSGVLRMVGHRRFVFAMVVAIAMTGCTSSRTKASPDTTGPDCSVATCFRPEARPASTLRMAPPSTAPFTLILIPGGDGYIEYFTGTDGREYSLGVQWGGGPPGYEALLASLRQTGNAVDDITVNGSPGLQATCTGTGTKTINGVPVGTPQSTGSLTRYWSVDGWTVSLGLADQANTDCALDGPAAKAIASNADSINRLSDQEWNDLLAAQPSGCTPGPFTPTPATVLRCPTDK